MRGFALVVAIVSLFGCSSTQLGTLPAHPDSVVRTAAELLGCPYPSGDVWQRNITKTPLDPKSAAFLTAYKAVAGERGFIANAPTTNERYNIADDSTPLVVPSPEVPYHRPYRPVPFEPGFYIEPLHDRHMLTLQTQNCHYYEAYGAKYGNGVLSEYNGGMWDLTKPFVRPPTGSISTASGIPMGLVAIRPEELSAGVILHALGWDSVEHAMSQKACVSPAGETDCTDDLQYAGPRADTPMPYGAQIRLNAGFNDSAFPKEAKAVAEAMKTYGAYQYDTGCCNTILMVSDSQGNPVWTAADAAALKHITPADLDVVEHP
jgi:hypothetical protein